MEVVIFALAGAFSFAIIKWKLGHERKADAILDGFTMAILMYFFSGTATGGAVAMVMSALISIYLIFDPLQFVMPKILSINKKTIAGVNMILLSIVVLASLFYMYGLING